MKRPPVDMVATWHPERAIDLREVTTGLASLAAVSAFVATLAAVAVLISF